MTEHRSTHILGANECLQFFAHSDTGFILERVYRFGPFFMVCRNHITEGLAGLSNDDQNIYEVSWELTGNELIYGNKYMILEGWGDEQSSGNAQFEGHRLAVPELEMYRVLRNLMKMHPDLYNPENYDQVTALDDYHFD